VAGGANGGSWGGGWYGGVPVYGYGYGYRALHAYYPRYRRYGYWHY
jgi:hypothetical protein